MPLEVSNDCGIGRRGYSRWKSPRQHKPIAGRGEPFDCLEQGVHRLGGRRQAWHIDVGCLLVGFIDDLDSNTGLPRNAHKLVVNVLAGEKTLEGISIVLAEKARDGGSEADVR